MAQLLSKDQVEGHQIRFAEGLTLLSWDGLEQERSKAEGLQSSLSIPCLRQSV